MDTETRTLVTSQELYNTLNVCHVDASTLHSIDTRMPETALKHETEKTCSNSSIVCEVYEELDQEADENTLVTIIISDLSVAAKNVGEPPSPPDTHVAEKFTPLIDPCHFRKCLEQCLKLACCDKTEVCCFLCPETYTSFVDLRKHLRQTHNLTHSVAQPLNIVPMKCITEIAKEVKKLECKCTTFMCAVCEVTHTHVLQLVQHVLLDHPTHYGDFPFFTEQQQRSSLKMCQRCTILDKLCHIDYDLFVKVFLDCVECSDEDCKTLLLSWPLAHCSEPCEWCAEESEGEGAGNTASTHGRERDVVCYRIKQKYSNKNSQRIGTSKCICPLIKCPECPQTVANYSDLRKHVRQNNHGTWHDLRLVWEKYKVIKENCPVCPKHSYHNYILCPHCPHLAFESEKVAQTHMDSQHSTQDEEQLHDACTCPNHFLCLKCNTSYPTPQSLHSHMRQKQHETPENFAAIPAMIKRSFDDRKGCPRCSLQDSHNASGSQKKEEECSCRWAKCSTCKTSFRRVSSLLDHTLRAKHPMSAKDIRKEREKLASSVTVCRRCCIEASKFCMLCHRKENFMYSHLRTCHQDSQIMLLRDDCGNLLEEHHTESWDGRRLARYECSVCRVCYPRFNELWCHVLRQHPRCYFTVMCLDMSKDVCQVKDFVAHDELMVLNVVDKLL